MSDSEDDQKSMLSAPVGVRSVITITEELVPIGKQSAVVNLYALSVFLYGLAQTLPSVLLTLDKDVSAFLAIASITLTLTLLLVQTSLHGHRTRVRDGSRTLS